MDSNFTFLGDLLNCICDDIQDRLLSTNDPELAKLLDACYCRLSYVSQRINNYIIIHGGK